MKGLEPSTFCMANARDRSLPFASVRSNRCLQGFTFTRANVSEPERTPNLAILATASGAESELVEPFGDRLACSATSR
jgi:hypothetical protein